MIVGLVLAPHYSSYSIGEYLNRCRDGAGAHPGDRHRQLGDRAGVRRLPRQRSRRTAGGDAGRHGRDVRVLFTAHSLPQRIIDAGDPYPDELRSTAVAVAERLGLSEGTDWSIAWQSAGRTPEPWIGPDILQVIDELGAAGDVGGVIVCACGFVADHLEVLYDLDIEAAARASTAGLAFDRTASVNGDPAVMAALADRIVDAVDQPLAAAVDQPMPPPAP